MSAVKPLTVVTKLGRAYVDGKPIGLSPHGSIVTSCAQQIEWRHEDCVTLADAERYAAEKVNAALICERDAVARNAPAREAFNERVAERRLRILTEEQPPENHGSFYLETQADLVLKARVDELICRVDKLYADLGPLFKRVLILEGDLRP